MADASMAPEHTLTLARQREAHIVTGMNGDDAECCRLMEMGLGVGAGVSIERAGNPAIVRVGASRVALSSELMDRVNVRCIH